MKTLALAALLLLPSCGLYDTYTKLKESVDKLDVKVTQIDKVSDTIVDGAALFGEKAQPVIDAAQNLKQAAREGQAASRHHGVDTRTDPHLAGLS